MAVRQWLGENNYEDVGALIDEVMAEFAAAGSKERRNWADVLSGGKNGKPVIVSGREFSVLASAQISRGKPVTPNAIRRNAVEEFPAARRTGRWPAKTQVTKQVPKGVKRTAHKASRKRASRHAQAS